MKKVTSPLKTTCDPGAAREGLLALSVGLACGSCTN